MFSLHIYWILINKVLDVKPLVPYLSENANSLTNTKRPMSFFYNGGQCCLGEVNVIAPLKHFWDGKMDSSILTSSTLMSYHGFRQSILTSALMSYHGFRKVQKVRFVDEIQIWVLDHSGTCSDSIEWWCELQKPCWQLQKPCWQFLCCGFPSQILEKKTSINLQCTFLWENLKPLIWTTQYEKFHNWEGYSSIINVKTSRGK